MGGSGVAEQTEGRTRLGLDEELRSLVQTRVPERHVASVVARLGFAGQPRPTLEAIGRTRGLTRERIRQVVASFARALASDPPPTPAFDAFLARVERLAPIGALAVTELARLAGSAGPWEPKVLLDVAATLGRATTVALHPSRKVSVLLREGDRRVVDAIYRSLYDGFPGVQTARWIAAAASEELGEDVAVETVLRIVPGVRGFEWLVPGNEGFFWIGRAQRNHLVTNVLKVLCAVGEVELAHLGDAVRHAQRFHRDHAVPDAVVEAVCRRLPGVVVDRDLVRADRPLSREVLSTPERLFLDVFEREGPVQRFTRLRDALVTTDLHEGNLVRLTHTSPLFVELRRGVYALIGSGAHAAEPAVDVEGIGFESSTLDRPPRDAPGLARLAREECASAARRGGARDVYVVRIAGARMERWALDVAGPVDEVARAIANQRLPVADGVALVRRASRRTSAGDVPGVGVIAEQGGWVVETWAAGSGPVLEAEPEDVGAGGLWIGVDAGRTLDELLAASRAERTRRRRERA